MIIGDELRALLTALDPVEAAPRLLGARLRASGPGSATELRLTEVEAYAGADDPGSHAHRGRTARNATMFDEAGRLYVYFAYGMHCCANLVVGPAGRPGAVLLRGAEVLAGAEAARARRSAFRRPGAAALRDNELARGPGNLARALGAGLDDDGADAVGPGRFTLALVPEPQWRDEVRPRIRRSLRTGVAAPGGLAPFEWRWHLAGAGGVSPYRPHRTVRG